MPDMLKKRLGRMVGLVGVLFGLLSAIGYAFNTFWQPLPPYVSHPPDNWIAIAYLFIFLVVAVFFFARKYRWLHLLGFLLVTVAILVPLRNVQMVQSFLLLGWFLSVSWIIGDVLICLLRVTADLTPGERLIFGVVLGWGALVVLTLLLGVIGLYQRRVFYALFGLISLWGLWRCRERFRRFSFGWFPISKFESLSITLVVIIALGSFFWALAPAVRYDSLSYHLAVPVRYLQAGRMIELPESFQTYWAHFGEMFYVMALSLGDQPLTGLINFSAGLLLAAQVFFIGKRLVNHMTGLMAALVLYSLPIIGIESATTYIDIFVAVFFTAALHCGLIWEHSLKGGWLVLLGVFSGLALGTKLSAFWLLLPFWGLLMWRLHCHRRLTWRNIAAVYVPAILLWSPWLLRDWLWTGNPVFPNLNPLFQSPQWFDRNFFIFQPTTNTLRSILFFPWRGVAQSHVYYHEAPGAVLAGLPLLSLPWYYHQRKNLLILFGVSAMALAMLFSFGASARYLMPLFPLLSVLAAANIQMTVAKLSVWRMDYTTGFVVLCLVYLFSTRLAFTVRWWEIPERYPIQIWSGSESREQFLDRILPVYAAFEYLDRQGSFKVLSVGNELRLYTDSEIFGPYFSKEAYQALHATTSADELALFLAEKGYDYILTYPPEQQHRPEMYTSDVLSGEFYDRYTQLEFEHRDVYLYRLIPFDP